MGTGAALLGSAALGLGGSLVKGQMDAKAAGKAADVQNVASLGALALQQQGLDFTKQQYSDARQDAAPWMSAGRQSLHQYLVETGQTGGQSRFRQSPGYAFQVSEGEKGVKNNLASLGMKNSGSALKALTRFRTGLADQSFDNYLTRLGGIAGAGQSATQDVSALGAQAAGAVNANLNNQGQSLQDAATARGSGYVGQANAWGSALTGGVNTLSNALGRYSTGNYGMPPQTPKWGAA